MNNLRYAFYYTTRNILWQYVYVTLYGGILVVVLLLLSLLVSLICNLIGIEEETNELVLPVLQIVFVLLCGLAAIASGFLAQKKALQKVFFKPYKRFRIIPKIDRVTAKMVWFYILLSLPIFLLSGFVGGLLRPHFNVANGLNAELIKYNIMFAICGTPFSYMYTLFINRYFVNKYATIVDKTKDDDANSPVTISDDKV